MFDAVIDTVLRLAGPDESDALVGLLTSTTEDPFLRWFGGEAGADASALRALLATDVAATLASGFIGVAVHGTDILAAALWTIHPVRAGVLAGSLRPHHRGLIAERLRRLQLLAEVRRPATPHHQLGLVVVQPNLRGHGLGALLLRGQHEYLDDIGLGAYAVTVDGSRRRLLLRCGYSDIGAPQLLPGATPVWSMWRPPKTDRKDVRAGVPMDSL
ncbi:hypothetical protein OWR29_26090 [Actinoplanes sp. Pm04-4]|uniref:N-acetyltransferase domain-containing protein n=1 Tax=Paractinoplanes pyxinae TaxID=2997416 RepID=A0ABT4B4Q9_9ACTN|nr:hypothetical protein [Actinoplanes pyxinae]MCY1141482.1 hypothetical protein [Actinoplanes pyxinae]